MDKFPEKSNLLKLLQEETENQNSPIETIIKKNFPKKKYYLFINVFIHLYFSIVWYFV